MWDCRYSLLGLLTQFLILSSCYWSSIILYIPFFITVTQDHEWLSQIYPVHSSMQCRALGVHPCCVAPRAAAPSHTKQWSHWDAPKVVSLRRSGWVGPRACLQDSPFPWWCPESPLSLGVERTAHRWTYTLVFFPLGIATQPLLCKLPSDSPLTLWDTSQELGKPSSCHLQQACKVLWNDPPSSPVGWVISKIIIPFWNHSWYLKRVLCISN